LIVAIDNSQPVAALMSINFADRITNSFNFSPEFIALLEKSKSGSKIEFEMLTWKQSALA
jgi:hypothetical protein